MRPPLPMPALTTTASMPPKRSIVPSTAARVWSRSVTSHSKAAPRSPHAEATRSSSSGSRPTTATFAPRADARRAVSAPIPRAAPVTKIVLPAMLTVRTLPGGGFGRGLELRADALVDQLDELRAELVGAVECLGVDRVGRVGGLVVIRRVAERVRAADRDRGIPGDARAVRVGGDPRDDRLDAVVAVPGVLLAKLAAEGDQVGMERGGQHVALLGRVAHVTAADVVHAQEHRARLLEVLAVALEERRHAQLHRLLRAGQQHPDVERVEPLAVAVGQPQHGGDARGVVPGAGDNARERYVGQQ